MPEMKFKDRWPMATSKVNFVGEAAAVVADSPASARYSEQGQRGVFWRLLGEFRGNTPASRAPRCAALSFRSGEALQPLTGPSGGPRPDLAHCAHVSQSVGPPPSAGCPSQKAAPDVVAIPGAHLGVAKHPLHFQERVLHLGPNRCLVPLRQRFRSGSSFRRFPGRIATCHSTPRPRFSSRLWTP